MEQKSSRAFFKLSVGEFREMSRFMKLRVTNDGAEKRGEPLFVHFRWLLLKKRSGNLWRQIKLDLMKLVTGYFMINLVLRHLNSLRRIDGP